MSTSIAEIAEALADTHGISTLVLFGSRCTGTARPDSDLDIAVLTEQSDPELRRGLISKIAVQLSHLAPDGRVDVVLIDEAPELLRQRIMETGQVVMGGTARLWGEWRVRAMREHGDREPVRRLLRRAQKRRLERGELGGRSGRALQSARRTGRLSH